ncbi:MAG: O-antigen ligase family protein [Methylobacteriaceae bacterium]|nr:O-antigen ligase family protein [Methylobacteriaceae bacterium]
MPSRSAEIGGPGLPRVASPSARGLPGRLEAGALACLAAVPFGMAVANRSAPALLVLAALLGLAARAADGRIAASGAMLARALRAPVGLGCLAFLGFAGLSTGWSHAPRTSWATLGELALAAGGPLVLWATLPRPTPRWALRLAAGAVLAAGAWVAAELATGVVLRGALGFRNESFIFKRSATAILLVAWPIAALLRRERARLFAGSQIASVLVAAATAHSGATILGLVAGLPAAFLARVSARLAAGFLAAIVIASFAVAPVLGDLADRALPPRLLDRLENSHARERIVIWQSFGEIARLRPLTGAGFGTSTRMASSPLVASVPEEHRLMLGAWHAHNGFLQVWAETGAVGALLLLATLLALLRRLPRSERPAASLGLFAIATAIMLVGHSAWQGWWVACLGAGAIWLSAGAQPPGDAPSSAVAPPRNPVART